MAPRRSRSAGPIIDANALSTLSIIYPKKAPTVYNVMHENSLVVSDHSQSGARRNYTLAVVENTESTRRQNQGSILFELDKINHVNFGGMRFFRIKAKSPVKILRNYEMIELKIDDSSIILSEDVIVTRNPNRELTFQDPALKNALANISIHFNRFVSINNDAVTSGLTASVKKVFDLNAPHGKFAVKIFSFTTNNQDLEDAAENMRDAIVTSKHEAEVLRRLEHPNIIKFFEQFESPTVRLLVLECMDGNLVSLINKEGLPEQDVKFCMKQLLSAVVYMHAKQITHDDIKCDNILYKAVETLDGQVEYLYKLCDFGSAKINDGREWTLNLTLPYAAPEVLYAWRAGNHEVAEYDHEKADMFSLGVVAFSLATARFAFVYSEETETYTDRVPADDAKFNRLSILATTFMRNLMAFIPAARLTAADALTYPWFRDNVLRDHETRCNMFFNCVNLQTHEKPIVSLTTRRSARIEAKVTKERMQLESVPLLDRRNHTAAMMSTHAKPSRRSINRRRSSFRRRTSGAGESCLRI